MRNKLFQEALDNVSEESRQKIRDYTDAIDLAISFGEWLGKNKEYFEGKWYDVENPNSKDVLTSLNAYYGQTTEELFQIFKSRQ